MRCRHWIEVSAWTSGLGLMLLYASAFDYARAEGVDAARQIDQALWSRERKLAFAESSAKPGAPKGILRIPSVHLEVPIYLGANELNLNRGAAHIEGTSALSRPGNIGIAGHRDGFFRSLKDVQIDSEILLEADGRISVYRVSEILVVEPSEVDVLDATRVPTITLVTCYPFYFVGSAPLRYIVRAELV